MTNYNERLDEILYDYWARHRNCENGCQSPDDGEITKQAIKQLVADEFLELIGEYEPEYSNLNGNAGYWEVHGRNAFRAELRSKLAEWLGKEK